MPSSQQEIIIQAIHIFKHSDILRLILIGERNMNENLPEAGILNHASSQKYWIEHSYDKLIEIYRNAAGSGKT